MKVKESTLKETRGKHRGKSVNVCLENWRYVGERKGRDEMSNR